MTYLTVEVKIRDGKVVVSEPEKLPKSAKGILTISTELDSGDIDMSEAAADTWEKLGPSPEIDYGKL